MLDLEIAGAENASEGMAKLLEHRARAESHFGDLWRYHLTRKLERKAERLLLPFPRRPFEDPLHAIRLSGTPEDWEEGPGGRWFLTPEGFTRVRRLIREEQEQRRRGVLQWAAALTGLLGAATGLAALLRG